VKIDPPKIARFSKSPAAFRESLLIDADGGPRLFQPDDWQRRDFESLDGGWRRCVGQQVEYGLSRAYLERPRGHSKTTDEALMGLWAVVFAPGQITGVVAAGDRDQARLIRDAIARLVRANGWLSEILDIQAHRVANTATGSSLEILSSDADTSYGLTPDFVLIDELVHWANRDLWDSLISAAAKRQGCMVVVISNAGRGMGSSWQWEVREACRQSPEWYFSRLDGPVASWIVSDPRRLDEQRRLLPPKVYARLWLNEWQVEAGDALDGRDIQASIRLGGPKLHAPIDFNMPTLAALDIGLKNDRSALVVVQLDVLRQHINLVWCQAWSPLTRGGQVNLDDVERALVDVQGRYAPLLVAFDPWQCQHLAQRVRGKGVNMREFIFSAANCNHMAHSLLQVFRNGQISLYSDEALLRDLQRLLIEERSNGTYRLTAVRDREGHADRAMALAMLLPFAVSSLESWAAEASMPALPEFEPLVLL
jgi:phage terminase large subunit-like protein